MTDEIRIMTGQEAAPYNEMFPDSYLEHEDVLIVEGDLKIDGDYSDWYEDQIKQRDLGHTIVIVKGDVFVAGEIIDASLLVVGNLHCDYLYSDMATTSILGDADIRFAYFGRSPSGTFSILGTLKVPFLFNDVHASTIEDLGKDNILIGIGGEDGFFEYDLIPENFEIVLHESIYLVEHDEFNIDVFLTFLKEGKSPFKNISDETFSLDFDKITLLKRIEILKKDGKK